MPVEDEPVEALSLVGPQQIPVLVLTYLLQWLEVGRRWAGDKLEEKQGRGHTQEGVYMYMYKAAGYRWLTERSLSDGGICLLLNTAIESMSTSSC